MSERDLFNGSMGREKPIILTWQVHWHEGDETTLILPPRRLILPGQSRRRMVFVRRPRFNCLVSFPTPFSSVGSKPGGDSDILV